MSVWSMVFSSAATDVYSSKKRPALCQSSRSTARPMDSTSTESMPRARADAISRWSSEASPRVCSAPRSSRGQLVGSPLRSISAMAASCSGALSSRMGLV